MIEQTETDALRATIKDLGQALTEALIRLATMDALLIEQVRGTPPECMLGEIVRGNAALERAGMKRATTN